MANVLLVDDDASIRGSASRLLRLHGHEVTVASSAAEALGCLEKERFGLIVCDQNMPGQTGLQLLEALRASGRTMLFILHSGTEDPQLVQEAKKFGASFLLKGDSDLLDKVARVLAQ